MTTTEKSTELEDRLYAAERLGYKVHQDMAGWFGVNRQDRRITQPFGTAQEALEALEQRLQVECERIEENVRRAKIPASLLGVALPVNGDYAASRAHYYVEHFSPDSGDLSLCGPGMLQLAGAIAEQVARRGFHVRFTTAAEVIGAGTEAELLEPDLVVLNLGDLPAGCGGEAVDSNQVLAALAASSLCRLPEAPPRACRSSAVALMDYRRGELWCWRQSVARRTWILGVAPFSSCAKQLSSRHDDLVVHCDTVDIGVLSRSRSTCHRLECD